MQIPSLSRQARVARGTIRLTLYAVIAVYGLSFVPVKTRTRALNFAKHKIHAAVDAAISGKKP